MFIVLGLTFLGMALGYALRGHAVAGLLSHGVMPAILLLLFLLGVELGGNRDLAGALPRLGGAALLLAGAGIAGSLICAVCAGRFLRITPPPANFHQPPDHTA
ncbi:MULTISPECIES: LysO family transporter [unclassified Desulfovibrio]|uniref:LysO family transporter n=1 Tax=unclassified Desulfovibrio TaxID=2593640 RepID=UPI000F60031A|nr:MULTISPECIES: LysO family transporter [unclassified Desulfovibrio]RRD69286.1 DUF340 domain-containing protein [Desulfovibrio sp. OH1209_COT-279]RRD85746.1 DUF340 domain-containing protein [Desulfovibrio sp. OH1186_COT-070]